MGHHGVDLGSILGMVDASGREFCREEWADDFEEYAGLAVDTGELPGLDSHAVDGHAAGIVDSDVFFGVGLAFLGHLAVRTAGVLFDVTVESVAREGARRALAIARRRLRSEKAVAQADAADIDELARHVTATLADAVQREVPAVSTAELEAIVGVQLRFLTGSAEHGDGTSRRETGNS